MTASRACMSLALLASLGACRGTPEAAQRTVDVPEGVKVDVEIDGRESVPITSEGLRAVTPSYHDTDLRAWRLVAILPADAVKAGMQLDVEEQNGRRTIFARFGEKDGEPVLMVNRKGQVLIALIEPDNPFPAFHGRGGNRGQGARADRIRGVTKLRLTTN